MKKFFRNRAVNLINIHAAIKRFAIGVAEIFTAIYLYQLGLPLYQVFLVWISLFLIRAMIRPVGLWLAQKRGLRKSVLFGAVFFMGYYLLLGQVSGLDWWLALFIFYAAWADVFYWLPFHAYYAALGDHEDRGKQLGVRESLIGIASTAGPLIGGILINTLGFYAAFYTASILTLISTIPVYFAPEVKFGKEISFKKAWKERAGFWLYVGDGWLYNAHIFTWNIILFILLGNAATLGGLLSLAAFLQILAFLLLGNGIDNGSGKKIYRIGIILMILTIFGRAFLVETVTEVIFFDLIYALATCFYTPAVSTALYNSAKKSKNVLWFHFFAETGWDVGSTIALTFAALVTFLQFDPHWVLVFALGSFVVLNGVLGRYYQES